MADHQITVTIVTELKDDGLKQLEQYENQTIKIPVEVDFKSNQIKTDLQSALSSVKNQDFKQKIELDIDNSAWQKQLNTAQSLAKKSADSINKEFSNALKSTSYSNNLSNTVLGKNGISTATTESLSLAVASYNRAIQELNSTKFDFNNITAGLDEQNIYSYATALQEMVNVLQVVKEGLSGDIFSFDELSSTMGFDNIDQLNSALQEYQNTLTTLQTNAGDIGNQIGLQNVDALNTQMQQFYEGIVKTVGSMDNFSIEDLTKGLDVQVQEMTSSLDDALADVRAYREAYYNSTYDAEEYDSLSQQFELQTTQLEQAKAQLEEYQNALSNVSNASGVADLLSQYDQLSASNTEIMNSTDAFIQSLGNIDTASADFSNMTQGLEESKITIESLVQELSSADQELSSMQLSMETSEDMSQFTEQLDTIKELRTEISEMQSDLSQSSMDGTVLDTSQLDDWSSKATEISEKTQEIKESMSDFGDAMDVSIGDDATANLDSMVEQLEELMQKIDEIGDKMNTEIDLGKIFGDGGITGLESIGDSIEKLTSSLGNIDTGSAESLVQTLSQISDINFDSFQNLDLTGLSSMMDSVNESTKSFVEQESKLLESSLKSFTKAGGSTDSDIYSSLKDLQKELTSFNTASFSGNISDLGADMESFAQRAEEASKSVDQFVEQQKKIQELSKVSDSLDKSISSASSKLASSVEGQGSYDKINADLQEMKQLQEQIASSPNLVKDEDITRANQLVSETKELQSSLVPEYSGNGTWVGSFSNYTGLDTARDQMKEVIQLAHQANGEIVQFTGDTATGIAYTVTKQATGAVEDYTAKLNANKNAIYETSKGEAEYVTVGDRLISSISGKMSSITSYIASFVGLEDVINVAEQGFKTVEDIDSSLGQLQIVSGASGSQMDTYLENSVSLAKDLGQNVSDVIDTITTFSRLGYNVDEATELAEYASILSNVAEVDIGDATTGLTSAIKGFNLDASDAEHVSDVLITIGQNYAVSAGEILEGFERSSAAMNASGSTFEETAAIIAAGNAAVQDASQNTGLKVIEIYLYRTPLIARKA